MKHHVSESSHFPRVDAKIFLERDTVVIRVIAAECATANPCTLPGPLTTAYKGCWKLLRIGQRASTVRKHRARVACSTLLELFSTRIIPRRRTHRIRTAVAPGHFNRDVDRTGPVWALIAQNVISRRVNVDYGIVVGIPVRRHRLPTHRHYFHRTRLLQHGFRREVVFRLPLQSGCDGIFGSNLGHTRRRLPEAASATTYASTKRK